MEAMAADKHDRATIETQEQRLEKKVKMQEEHRASPKREAPQDIEEAELFGPDSEDEGPEIPVPPRHAKSNVERQLDSIPEDPEEDMESLVEEDSDYEDIEVLNDDNVESADEMHLAPTPGMAQGSGERSLAPSDDAVVAKPRKRGRDAGAEGALGSTEDDGDAEMDEPIDSPRQKRQARLLPTPGEPDHECAASSS